jgi:hypothetical protein
MCSAEQFKTFSRTSKNAAQLPLVTVDSTGLSFATLQDKLNVFAFKQSHQASLEADVFYAILDSTSHTYTHPSYSLGSLP